MCRQFAINLIIIIVIVIGRMPAISILMPIKRRSCLHRLVPAAPLSPTLLIKEVREEKDRSLGNTQVHS